MRPQNLKTKIFLDSADPEETKKALEIIGFLDGQTTNPSLLAKLEAEKFIQKGGKISNKEIYKRYKEIVTEISELIPDGSISIEVYGDMTTKAEEMFEQGKEMFSWIPNAQVKYPIIKAGLAAAEMSIKANMRVNMTLCFDEEQAATVYAATIGAKKGDVYVSPFIGRLDDIGENGMMLISNILEDFKQGDGHVEVLAASVRTMEHFLYSLVLGVDIITAPLKILSEWAEKGMSIPEKEYIYDSYKFKDIPYKNISLNKSWTEYNYQHELTDKGIEKFVADWNSIVIKEN